MSAPFFDEGAAPPPDGRPGRAVRVALLGAESTGKTSLARALGEALRARGHRVAVVPEVLREFCDRQARTPRADEQAGIAREQTQRIDAAAAGHDVVVADTSALMIAVYSAHLFGDDTLLAAALEHLRGFRVVLLTGLDLPWVEDGHQRDGPHVRVPVDLRLREALRSGGIGFSVVHGEGPARTQAALAAVEAAWPGARRDGTHETAPRRPGLFTGLLAAGTASAPAPAWFCDCCDVPEFERQSLRAGK